MFNSPVTFRTGPRFAHSLITRLTIVASLAAGTVSATAQPRSFIEFESGQVRPLAMTPDGSQLLAVNTPDNRLEVFTVDGGALVHTDSIPVGMEPVSVAARDDNEIWVVNHLSDSVSVIDLAANPAKVVRTLLVGDEPRDIVFAGTDFDRAFITTAHRGQHRTDNSISGMPGAGDPQFSIEGIGRADVWVFNATNLGNTIGGTPEKILNFFADTPRALAVTPDGGTVYVAAFQSGNQTATVNETVVPNGFGPGKVPGPNVNFQGITAPQNGLIVKFNGSNWLDSNATNWNSKILFNLPDHDVFSIDANTLASDSIVAYDHVGTVLFNMVVNPLSGKVYVTNTELPNHVNFEGPGVFGGSTVQGHLSESRISVLDPAGPDVDVQHLNQHIDYDQLHTDSGANHAVINAQKIHSLATPLQPIISSDGGTLYVAAFGSARVGVFDVEDVEDVAFESNFDPTTQSANYIATSGGPSGLVLDETNERLYVLTRFGNKVEVIDLATKARIATHKLHNPEPTKIVAGRPFLYDANATSGNGEASCSSCHIFGDVDQLAWNLGNPDDAVTASPLPAAFVSPSLPNATTFHPMKGPMVTQTLRGLATHGPMHWRGDRANGFFGQDPCNILVTTGAACDEGLSFRNFIVAFESLVGKQGKITNNEMQKFTDFVLEIMLPPNPVRALGNSLSPSAASGLSLFNGRTTDGATNCNGCHTLDPARGFFGSNGGQTFERETMNFKVPHLRNMYQKIGMFGSFIAGSHTGDQVRGYGYLHDGTVDTLHHFFDPRAFTVTEAERLQLQSLMLEFPSDLAPIVGQQVTLDANSPTEVSARIDLMIQRAATNFTSIMLGGAMKECDLIAKGSVGGVERGWVRMADGQFRSDIDTLVSEASLRVLATTEGPLTYTCAPPGSGIRMGINRDEDNFPDGLDNCPTVANNSQADGDNDSIGDACDSTGLDGDNDGIADGLDNCPAAANPNQADSDNDGQGDVCEPTPGC